MPAEDPLRSFVQASIRAEKARRGLTYGALSRALAEHGIRQSPTNLSTKLGRGDMSARLFLAIMKVLGCRRIELERLDLPRAAARKRA